ncbi:hypothetical protein [Roseibium sp. MMSF_3544]|uniref:hypothetical protein n=1 Tax=unclassified Roseibium TaxID=2629323 RepID=UPI00273FE314|nr:hypothetical protein [Roseibium sp. MMSF_3544]
MTKYAEIIDGKVVTISFDPKTGWPAVHDSVFPGDTDNGDGTFSRPPARPKHTLETAKALIVEYAAAFEDHITGSVSIGEKLSWATKEAAARAQTAGTADADHLALLQAEAAQTGETVDELSAKILSNATAWQQITGSVAGLRRSTFRALEAEADPVKYRAILETALAKADALAVSLGLEPMAWET